MFAPTHYARSDAPPPSTIRGSQRYRGRDTENQLDRYSEDEEYENEEDDDNNSLTESYHASARQARRIRERAQTKEGYISLRTSILRYKHLDIITGAELHGWREAIENLEDNYNRLENLIGLYRQHGSSGRDRQVLWRNFWAPTARNGVPRVFVGSDGGVERGCVGGC